MNRPRFYLALLVAACAASSAQADRIITTVAGGGPDRVQALAAALYPYDLVMDSSGNVLILSDPGVLRVDASGRLTLLAGAGTSSYSGDGGTAREAQFFFPTAMALDPQGRLVIAELHGHRVRRIETDGTVSTIAGTGVETGSLDSPWNGATEDDMGDGLPATQATLRSPRGLAFTPGGDLLISDSGNVRIRVVDSGTGIITTRVGVGDSIDPFQGDGGDAGLASLWDVGPLAIDEAGNLFFVDGHRVRRVDHLTNIVTTVAGQVTGGGDENIGDGGPATGALLAQPSDLAVRGQTLAIADTNHSRVRLVDLTTGLIRTVAGTGLDLGYLDGPGGDPADDFKTGVPAAQALLSGPSTVAFLTSGDLLIGCGGRVVRVDAATETLQAWAGTGDFPGGDGGQARRAWLGWTHGLVVLDDHLYIAGQGVNNGASVRTVDAVTGRITTVAGCVDAADCVQTDGAAPTRRALVQATVSPAPAGDVLVIDTGQSMVFRLDPEAGTMVRLAGNGSSDTGDGVPATETGLPHPRAAAYGPDGHLYILQSDAYLTGICLRRVDSATGVISSLVGTSCPGDWFSTYLPEMYGVVGLAFDPAGGLHLLNNGRIFILDLDTWAITPVVGDGVFEDSGDGGPALSARLGYASRFGFDAAGNLVILDVGANRIRSIGADGIIRTIAGSGEWGFSGDGGAAVDAKLSLGDFGSGLALPANGDVFLADTNSSRVRLVTEEALPIAQAGSDRMLQCEGPQGASVTLDGSGSTGSGALTFAWEGQFGEATGVAPVVTLPIGSSGISLVARQGFLASQPDEAAVLVFVRPVGLSEPLDRLVPESDPTTSPGPFYRLGAKVRLELGLDCLGGRLDSIGAPGPVLVEIRRNGVATSLAGPDGLAFQPGARASWGLELRTRSWEAGAYEVVIRMPDGRRFKAGFQLRSGRIDQGRPA